MEVGWRHGVVRLMDHLMNFYVDSEASELTVSISPYVCTYLAYLRPTYHIHRFAVGSQVPHTFPPQIRDERGLERGLVSGNSWFDLLNSYSRL